MRNTTDYFLMSLLDNEASPVAENLGAAFLDKQTGDFGRLGREYSGKLVYIVDPNNLAGEMVKRKIQSGAVSSGVESPRLIYFEDPHEALRRFPAEQPAAAVVAYLMEIKSGIRGSEVIRRMRELERT